MTESRSKFDTDLDKLEFVTMRQAYSWAMTDLYLILADEMTPETTQAFTRVKERMEAMEKMRFPTQEN